MKDAYNQVEIAEKANEEIQTVHQQAAYDPSPEELIGKDKLIKCTGKCGSPQVNYTEQVPTQIPQIRVPQVQKCPKHPLQFTIINTNSHMFSSLTYNSHILRCSTKGIVSSRITGNFKNQMTNGQTPMMQVPNRSGLPVGLWFFMGLVLGLIIAIAGLKLAPQSIAESIRPDLVEKGKNL